MTPYRAIAIALDFDCSFTADIEFWRLFVRLCVQRGHTVWVVTARHSTFENRALVPDVIGAPTMQLLAGLIFTDHRPKRATAAARGVKIDVWIDDLPEFVGNASPELLEAIKLHQPIGETLPVVAMGAVDPNAVWQPDAQ
jgi:hypothetical protein